MSTESPSNSRFNSKSDFKSGTNSEETVQFTSVFKSFKVKQAGSSFGRGKKALKALQDINFTLKTNEVLAIVGESGCGKSTLAKCLMGIESQTSGTIKIEGRAIQSYSRKELAQKIQMIFQDPYSSLNPRKTVAQIIAEPLLIFGGFNKSEIQDKVNEVLQQVGLRPEQGGRYPHMFSGGQRQRIGIARALISRPSILVCDEPVSALDVSIQAQIINLLQDIRVAKKLSIIFISHDLSVVRYLADRVIVMYLGKIVEVATKYELFTNPRHPYTRLLMQSVPSAEVVSIQSSGPAVNSVKVEKFEVRGEIPSPLNPPTGCAFHPRCALATDKCRRDSPELEVKASSPTLVRCFEVS